MSAVLTNRGVTIVRVAVILIVLFTVLFLKDLWLPHAQTAYQSAYDKYKGEAPWIPSNPDPAEQPEYDSQILNESPSPTPLQHTVAISVPVPSPVFTDSARTKTNDEDEPCLHLPGADKVLVMLKTGATELYQKLPTHFVTTLRCIPNYMVFSDLNQTFGETQIYDAIAPVTEKTKEEHEDFTLYREINKWQREGQDIAKLKGDSGWSLDKWKFLPMLHQTFESAGKDVEWFVMMEADTSLSWLNLMLWLKTMDPTKPYYLGAQNLLGDTTFGHGGSGIVISRKAADTLVAARLHAGKETYDQQWEEQTAHSCCGDGIVAEAFLAVDIPLTRAWPLLQGEQISTVDFSSNHWCAPPITWHHVHPIEVDAAWQFEKNWTGQYGWEKPYLYRDVFAHFIEPHIAVNRTHWNNLSNDWKFVAESLTTTTDNDFHSLEKYEQAAVESEEACAKACMRKGEGCRQWMFRPGRCHLGKELRFGSSDDHDDEHWNCGWIPDRVSELKKSLEDCSIRWQG